MDESEQIRRDFAEAWGQIGAAWGVAPSTATVQGYLLLHGGPLTEAELRVALGLSHRAAFTALTECEGWGLIRQVEPRRAGRRGPAGRAWTPVGDHWEWFRRVVAARKARETDPIIPLLDECLARADAAGDADLRARVGSLLQFTHQFDRGIGTVVNTDAERLSYLFSVLDRLDDGVVERAIGVLAQIPADELAEAATTVSSMHPQLLGRVVRFIRRPGVARLLARIGH